MVKSPPTFFSEGQRSDYRVMCHFFFNVRIRKMNADCISEYEMVFAKTALGIVSV